MIGWDLQEQHLEQYRQQQPGAIPYLEVSGLWLYRCDDGLSVRSLKSSTPFFHILDIAERLSRGQHHDGKISHGPAYATLPSFYKRCVNSQHRGQDLASLIRGCVGVDIDLPTGKASSQTCVLPLLANRK